VSSLFLKGIHDNGNGNGNGNYNGNGSSDEADRAD
jgi:hypothetical protein